MGVVHFNLILIFSCSFSHVSNRFLCCCSGWIWRIVVFLANYYTASLRRRPCLATLSMLFASPKAEIRSETLVSSCRCNPGQFFPPRFVSTKLAMLSAALMAAGWYAPLYTSLAKVQVVKNVLMQQCTCVLRRCKL